MNEKKSVAERFDRDLALKYMEKARLAGRTNSDGMWDYLETLGIRRPEATDAVLEKFREEDRKSDERILGYLNQMRELYRAAQARYSRV